MSLLRMFWSVPISSDNDLDAMEVMGIYKAVVNRMGCDAFANIRRLKY